MSPNNSSSINILFNIKFLSDCDSSEIYMSSDFVVKGGPLDEILVMRPMMKGVFKKLMSGLAYHCVTGKLVGEELPPNEELAKIILG